MLTQLTRQGLLQKSNFHLEELGWLAWSAATLSSGLEFSCTIQAKMVARILQNSARHGLSACAKDLQAAQAMMWASSFTGQLNGHLELAAHELGQTTGRATDASSRTYYVKRLADGIVNRPRKKFSESNRAGLILDLLDSRKPRIPFHNSLNYGIGNRDLVKDCKGAR